MFEEDCIVRLKFPQKLWYLLNAKSGAVKWGAFGKTILLNYKELQQYLKCDQSIFKTSRISSFIRQLNLYGFRKVTSHLQDPLISSVNPDLHEYTHDFFQYGKSDLLNNIKRKTWNYRKDFVFKLENSKNYCSHRVRRARKNFQRVLKKAAREMFGIIEENENFSEENEGPQDSESVNNFILPINVNDISCQQYIPSTYPDMSIEPYATIPQDMSRSDVMEGINLSSYIQNFSVSESILEDTSAIEESLGSSQYSYWENDASMINTPQDPIYCDFLTSNLNNNVKVEVIDTYHEKECYSFDDDACYTKEDEAKSVENSINNSQSKNIENDMLNPAADQSWISSKKISAESHAILEEEYGSELKELYIQISKSVDLLNSE